MFYLYDEKTCEIYSSSKVEPTEGLYCTSVMDFDLDLYRVIVGTVNTDKQLTYYTQKAKPAEQLVQQLINIRQSQHDADIEALELGYRLTLLENNVKEGEIE